MDAGTPSYVKARLKVEAVKPTGVQLKAVIQKANEKDYPLTLAVAVSTTLIVPACVRSDPNRATLVPSTWMKEGGAFKVYETEELQVGVQVRLGIGTRIFGQPST